MVVLTEQFLRQYLIQIMRSTLHLYILKVHLLFPFPRIAILQFLRKLSKKPVQHLKTASTHVRETIGLIMLPIVSAVQVKQRTWLRGVWVWVKIYVQSNVAKLLTIKK
jgi:hypothetical protein